MNGYILALWMYIFLYKFRYSLSYFFILFHH